MPPSTALKALLGSSIVFRRAECGFRTSGIVRLRFAAKQLVDLVDRERLAFQQRLRKLFELVAVRIQAIARRLHRPFRNPADLEIDLARRFGADRIFDVLNQLDLYPKETVTGTELLFVNFGAAEAAYCLPVMAQARQAGVRCEIYPDSAKMKKQMSYANAKAVPFVAIVGENEMNEGKVTLKNMATGEQSLLTPDEMINIIKK